MRLAALQLRHVVDASSAGPFIRLAPYVAVVVTLKLYAMSLLFSSGLLGRRSGGPQGLELRLNDIPHRQKEPEIVSTDEPGWEEKHDVLQHLMTRTIQPSPQNRTRPDQIWLFFNRIPRSGGKTLVALLQALGSDLDYQHQEHVYRTPWQRFMTKDEQRNLAIWFEYNFWPKTYDRLALYINFTEHKSPYVTQRPASITLLRDPVTQFISQFHNRRIHHDTVKKIMAAHDRVTPGGGRRWYWRELEDCILDEDPECDLMEGQDDFERSIPFLCGQHDFCVKRGDRRALQRAKYMAEYEYAVVGVLDEWNSTLAVMQHYLPIFFQGAVQRYWSAEFAEDRHLNRIPKRKKQLSERALQILQSKLASEYELYEFCKQRLALQYEKVLPLLRFTSPLPPIKGPKKGLSAWDRFNIELNY
ncbi:Sulfotransferase [Trinorchestia longiramus]|nr:Sulfotransferase [Trinorchestia longiramus]